MLTTLTIIAMPAVFAIAYIVIGIRSTKLRKRLEQEMIQDAFNKRMAKQERAIRRYQHACGCSAEEAHVRWCEKCACKWAEGN